MLELMSLFREAGNGHKQGSIAVQAVSAIMIEITDNSVSLQVIEKIVDHTLARQVENSRSPEDKTLETQKIRETMEE